MKLSRRQLGLAAGALATACLSLFPAPVAHASEEAAINEAVEAFRKAMLTADKGAFDALTAEQLSYGHSAGRLESKAQFIAAATSGKSVWKFIDLSEKSASVVGNNAVVRHILTGQTESEGKTNEIKIGILMVWTKQDGKWKLLARQAYRI